jgi:uncharacterized protein (TIGR03435 family)
VGSNVSLRALIFFAYALTPDDRVESRSQLIDQTFDVLAKAAADAPPAPAGTVGPLNLMMQHLLATRFSLVVRVEQRSQQGYALVRARADGRLGPGLRPAPLCGGGTIATPAKVNCATRVLNNELRGEGQNMERMARMLSVSLGSPVVDNTGLEGAFDVRMTFDQRALRQFSGPPLRGSDEAPSRLPSLFVAMQEQLGLKLQPQSIPVRVLIVEGVAPPSEN